MNGLLGKATLYTHPVNPKRKRIRRRYVCVSGKLIRSIYDLVNNNNANANEKRFTDWR